MENNGNTEFNFLAFNLQPLAFASVAEIVGKFGGADQLRNAVPKLQAEGWENEPHFIAEQCRFSQ